MSQGGIPGRGRVMNHQHLGESAGLRRGRGKHQINTGKNVSKRSLVPGDHGDGRRPGHDNDMEVPSALIVASGPVPPPEKLIVSPGTAAGLNAPSAFRSSVVLTGTQPRPDRTRTGKTCSVRVRPPLGVTATCVVPVVRAPATTGVPDAPACLAAAAIDASSAPLNDESEPRPMVASGDGWAGVCGSGAPVSGAGDEAAGPVTAPAAPTADATGSNITGQATAAIRASRTKRPANARS